MSFLAKTSQNKMSRGMLTLMFFVGCFTLPLMGSSQEEFKSINQKEQHHEEKEGKLHASYDDKRVKSADCGVYVKSFGKFDYTKNTLFINFYIWWLLDKDMTYLPEETMEITNAQEYKRLWAARDTIHNKIRVQARYNATINQDWDMKYFPFDRQRIVISLEDNIGELNTVRLKAIPHNSKISPDINFNGWQLIKFDLVPEVHHYNTNFGNLSEDTSVTSRLNIIFELKREGWRIFFLYFIGYIAALFLCILTYFVPKRYFEQTITLSLGAIFAGMGNKYQLDQNIADISVAGLSLSGMATICTFSAILLSTINAVITHTLYINDRQKLALGINYSVLLVLMVCYISVLGTTLREAVLS